MSQENSRWKQINWRLLAVEALLVGALLLLTSGVLAYTGGWNAMFGSQPASAEESLPAAPEIESAPVIVPLDSEKPAGDGLGGSGCEHERMDSVPQGMD
jgi:hypothetical protein